MIQMASKKLITIVVLIYLSANTECRRVRLKPTGISAATSDQEDNQPLSRQILYFNPEEQTQQSEEEEEQPVVIAARQSNYNRPSPTQHTRIRADHSGPSKTPPVQTIRNFNKLNDDGSFTFGYESADGSFKEETRGTDCVVRGKYGYVDPDGNKREFTYVSGNPCDPNAVSQEEDEEDLKDKSNEEENIPANIPQNIPPRPNLALRTGSTRNKPATTLFQQSFNNDDSLPSAEEQDNQLQLNVKQPVRQVYRNNLILDEEPRIRQQVLRPTIRPRLVYHPQNQPRLISRPTGADNQPATTYRPQIIQYPVTPTNPTTTLYAKQSAQPAYIATPASPTTYFDEQFKKFQLESNSIPSEAPLSKTLSNNPIYSTELIYDPATGQYNTVVYQQIPKAAGQKLPFVSTPQPLSAQRPLLSSTSTESPLYQQQLIQQQQANQVAQSQHLYNLQLRQQQLQRFPQVNAAKPVAPPRHQQQQTIVQRYPPEPQRFSQGPQRFSPEPQRFSSEPHKYGFSDGYPVPDSQQPFYYFNQALTDERQGYASGQIDSFLRGHHFQY